MNKEELLEEIKKDGIISSIQNITSFIINKEKEEIKKFMEEIALEEYQIINDDGDDIQYIDYIFFDCNAVENGTDCRSIISDIINSNKKESKENTEKLWNILSGIDDYLEKYKKELNEEEKFIFNYLKDNILIYRINYTNDNYEDLVFFIAINLKEKIVKVYKSIIDCESGLPRILYALNTSEEKEKEYEQKT